MALEKTYGSLNEGWYCHGAGVNMSTITSLVLGQGHAQISRKKTQPYQNIRAITGVKIRAELSPMLYQAQSQYIFVSHLSSRMYRVTGMN